MENQSNKKIKIKGEKVRLLHYRNRLYNRLLCDVILVLAFALAIVIIVVVDVDINEIHYKISRF